MFPESGLVQPIPLLLILVSIASWLAANGRASADEIPLPRPRPTKQLSHAAALPARPASKTGPALMSSSFTPPQEAYASLPEPAPTPVATTNEPSACQLRLTPDLAVVHPLPPIVGPGDCGALDVVRLEAIVLPDHAKVVVNPAATLRCSMAEAVAHWVRDEVVPALGESHAPLRGLENYDSFECRGRNRVVGAKVSEHGLANALDIKSLRLADGAILGLTDINVPREFRDGLRQSACARFMTVLGPGSDGYHESHIHIDLAERHNDYRICQWDVRVPLKADSEAAADGVPLPRPRPAVEYSPDLSAAGGKL